MEEHHIPIELKVRYYTSGPLSPDTEEVWIVGHGYGMLAKYFIRKFEPLQSSKRVIVAPEGSSKFYQDGFSGRVGANWMTKEDRLVDIENNIQFLNGVYNLILDKTNSSTRIIVFGFSQGVATFSRWVLHQEFHLDHLVLWAGDFPPDIEKDKARERLKDLKVTLVYGKQDEFITEERIQMQKDRFSALDHFPEIIIFDGGHDIPAESLLKVAELTSG